MARSANIQNPTRVAIATVEDQNKYQMARNRNIDQTNQYFETNVAADIKPEPKSNLLRLAEALQENSSTIREYVNRKEQEQSKQDIELGKKFALENPNLTMSEAEKEAIGKSIEFKNGLMTMVGHNASAKDSAELEGKWNNLPENERLNTNFATWASQQIKEKNNGITDTYFNSSYTNNMTDFMTKGATKSIIEKYSNVKEKYHNEFKEYVNNNTGLFLNDINLYQSIKDRMTNSGPMSKKEFDDIVFQSMNDKAESGDYKDIKTLEAFTKLIDSNPKSADGVPIFGKYANSGIGSKLMLKATQAVASKRNLDKTIEKQLWDEEYQSKVNEAFLMSRDGNVKGALKTLDDIIRKSTDTLELNEIRSYYSIIQNAHNEVLEANRRSQRGTSTGGTGGSGSAKASSEKNTNFNFLLIEATSGELTEQQSKEYAQKGIISAKDHEKLVTEIRQRETTKRTAINEKEKAKNEVVNQAYQTYKESVVMPNPISSSVPLQNKEDIVREMSLSRQRVRNAIEKAYDEGKIKNSFDIEEYIEPMIRQDNDKITKMVNFNPKSKFQTKENYDSIIKKQIYLESKGKPVPNKVEDWQQEIARKYFEKEQNKNKGK